MKRKREGKEQDEVKRRKEEKEESGNETGEGFRVQRYDMTNSKIWKEEYKGIKKEWSDLQKNFDRYHTSENTYEFSKGCFEWMIYPRTTDTFILDDWEKDVVVIKRNCPDYFSNLYSKKEIEECISAGKFKYMIDVDLAQYSVTGERRTLNGKGVAKSKDVWRRFEKELCSVRVLHPQRHSKKLAGVLAMFEEVWGCQGGCNAYLTPAGSQGFAPHFDDICAYVVQIEGKKTWSFYAPRSEEEAFPRHSSRNFKQEEIGEPLLTITLEAGDFCYFPRGIIHQAHTDNEHSLHLTFSTGYCQTWVDLFRTAFSNGLEDATEQLTPFRHSIPFSFFRQFGAQYEEVEEEGQKRKKGEDGDWEKSVGGGREEVRKKMHSMVDVLVDSLNFDAAADELALAFMSSRLPPPNASSNPKIPKFLKDTQFIRLSGSDSLRMVIIGEEIALYSHFTNTISTHAQVEEGEEEKEEEEEKNLLLRLPGELAETFEKLIRMYPSAMEIGSSEIPKEVISDLLEMKVIQVTESASPTNQE